MGYVKLMFAKLYITCWWVGYTWDGIWLLEVLLVLPSVIEVVSWDGLDECAACNTGTLGILIFVYAGGIGNS